MTACIFPVTPLTIVIHKPQTNADRIRAMSDVELVKFAMNNQCPPGNYFDQNLCTNAALTGKCEKCWLDWLKQEANDG